MVVRGDGGLGLRKATFSIHPAQFGIACFVLCLCAVGTMLPMRHINKLALASLAWLIFAATLLVDLSAFEQRKRHQGSGLGLLSGLFE